MWTLHPPSLPVVHELLTTERSGASAQSRVAARDRWAGWWPALERSKGKVGRVSMSHEHPARQGPASPPAWPRRSSPRKEIGAEGEQRDRLCAKAAGEPHSPVLAPEKHGLYFLECGPLGRSWCLAGRRSCTRRDRSSVLLPGLYQMILLTLRGTVALGASVFKTFCSVLLAGSK